MLPYESVDELRFRWNKAKHLLLNDATSSVSIEYLFHNESYMTTAYYFQVFDIDPTGKF